ncbi:MAG: hypothetical protein JRH11_25890 [Deltaproteobacteria bacterium]|nr:hypothetical protein [Deltaproteobacteria bacterium]
MKTAYAVLCTIVAAGALTMACEQNEQAQTGQDVGDNTEAGDAVTLEAANENLGSNTLRKIICEAIDVAQGAHVDSSDCLQFDFTITQFARSTAYSHLEDGREVTMQMLVTVENSSGGTYSATLARGLDDQFRLSWAATIDTTELEAARQFILELAYEAGEYPQWSDPELTDYIRPVSFEDLPVQIQEAAGTSLQDRFEWNNHGEGDGNTAFYADDRPFHEIVLDGFVAGYIIAIEDYLENALWDGSGVYYYLDKHGTEVTDVEWTG